MVPREKRWKQIDNLTVCLDRYLGHGATSTVYAGILKLTKEEEPDESKRDLPVAVKVIPREGFCEKKRKIMDQELQVISRLKHPNIVMFYTMKASKNSFYQVFELVKGKDLQHRLQEQKRYTELETQAIFRQFAAAIIHLNQNDFVHRDLKPANIMLTEDNVVKLADFGLAKKFNSDEDQLMRTTYGTPYYQAPEILEGK